MGMIMCLVAKKKRKYEKRENEQSWQAVAGSMNQFSLGTKIMWKKTEDGVLF